MAVEVSINYWAVLVATIAAMIIGMFWYSPKGLFGKQWMKLVAIPPKKMKAMQKKGGQSMFWGFVSTLVLSYVLAYVVDYAGAATLLGGIQTGFWIWLGFIATVQLGIVLWEGKPFKLYAINAGYHLVQLIVMGAILAVWA